MSREPTDAEIMSRLVAKWLVGIVVGGLILVFVWKGVSPQLNLYRANTEKQAVIAEQRAQSEAAEYAAKSRVTQATAEADAEVARAHGLAEAQKIISATLSEEYLRYLFIQQLDENAGQIIYVPTEAGLPILEAGRAVPTEVTVTAPADD
jgi:hypothetical protein